MRHRQYIQCVFLRVVAETCVAPPFVPSGLARRAAIKWEAMGCAKTDSNGKLHKTGCGNGWNAGAVSAAGVIGPATIEFQCTQKQHAMIGFGVGNDHNSYQDIDCAMYCDQGTLRVYELGRHSYNGPKYTWVPPSFILVFPSGPPCLLPRASASSTASSSHHLVSLSSATLLPRSPCFAPASLLVFQCPLRSPNIDPLPPSPSPCSRGIYPARRISC